MTLYTDFLGDFLVSLWLGGKVLFFCHQDAKAQSCTRLFMNKYIKMSGDFFFSVFPENDKERYCSDNCD